MSAIVLFGVVAAAVYLYEALKPKQKDPGKGDVPYSAPPLKTVPVTQKGNQTVPGSSFQPLAPARASSPVSPPAPPPSRPLVPAAPISLQPAKPSPPSSPPPSPPSAPSQPSVPQRYCATLPSLEGKWTSPVPIASDTQCQSDQISMSGVWDGTKWTDVTMHETPLQQSQCIWYKAGGVPICDVSNVPPPSN
jgi:hypothetical protein